MPFGDRAGHPTHWQSWRNGPRAAVALHCALGQAAMWDGIARALPLRLTAFDLPGHGNSGDWDGAAEYHGLCTRIAETFCDGPTDLIGHSFGATVALRLAVERPDLVRSLTLIEPVFFAAARADRAPEIADHDTAFSPFVEAIRDGDQMRAARIFTGLWGGGAPFDALPTVRQQALANRIHLIPAGAPGIEDDCGGLLRPGRLASVGCPVLLVRGDASPAIMGAIHRALLTRLPDAREIVLPDAAHMAPLTYAADVAAAIRPLFSP